MVGWEGGGPFFVEAARSSGVARVPLRVVDPTQPERRCGIAEVVLEDIGVVHPGIEGDRAGRSAGAARG